MPMVVRGEDLISMFPQCTAEPGRGWGGVGHCSVNRADGNNSAEPSSSSRAGRAITSEQPSAGYVLPQAEQPLARKTLNTTATRAF